MGWLPAWLGRLVWNTTTNKVSVSMSNVPGPQFAMKWCGGPVSRMLFFVPPTGTVSLFATIATLNGDVTVGLGGDAAVFSDETLEKIAGRYFEEEIKNLQRLVNTP